MYVIQDWHAMTTHDKDIAHSTYIGTHTQYWQPHQGYTIVVGYTEPY